MSNDFLNYHFLMGMSLIFTTNLVGWPELKNYCKWKWLVLALIWTPIFVLFCSVKYCRTHILYHIK
jgi:hypothetical protein